MHFHIMQNEFEQNISSKVEEDLKLTVDGKPRLRPKNKNSKKILGGQLVESVNPKWCIEKGNLTVSEHKTENYTPSETRQSDTFEALK